MWLTKAVFAVAFSITATIAVGQSYEALETQAAMSSIERMRATSDQLDRQQTNTSAESQAEQPMSDVPPPFGASLFEGGYEAERYEGLSEDYLVAPGDKVRVSMWGAVNQNELLTVDNQGNLFITNVGPVYVKDVRASQLNQVVTREVRSVYRENVNIYVNLLQATPVSVFVTGGVVRPGQYAGLAADSVLYFLQRAGGIDAGRGSYRDIQVKREGAVVSSFDLYDFLLNGEITSFNFKDGDIVFVANQNSVVDVAGSVRNPFRFEFSSDEPNGAELVQYARPMANTSHVGVSGDRDDGPFSMYLELSDFSEVVLRDGDRVFFNDDLKAEVISVEISGSFLGPSFFSVERGARLHDVLAMVEVDPSLAKFDSVYIERISVAQRQKEMIEESLQRLERSVFTSPVSSTGEGTIRAQEAQMVLQFTARAREVEPQGKVIVADNGVVANVLLEDGDTIVIPAVSDLVAVSGEVRMPQSFVHNDQADVEDYIAWAGGFTQRADYNEIMVIRPSGVFRWGDDQQIMPGDQILILPAVSPMTMQAVKDITQIIYQIAVAANVAIRS